MRRLPATAGPAEPALAIQRPLPLTVATLPAPAGEGGSESWVPFWLRPSGVPTFEKWRNARKLPILPRSPSSR